MMTLETANTKKRVVDFKTTVKRMYLFLLPVILVLITSCTGNTNPPSKKAADTADTLQRDTVPVCNYRDSVFGEYLECMKTAKSVSLLCERASMKEFYDSLGESIGIGLATTPFAFTKDSVQIRRIIESFPFRKEYPKDSIIEKILIIEHNNYYFVCEQETLIRFTKELGAIDRMHINETQYLVNDSIFYHLFDPILINKKRRTKKD